MSSYSQSLQQSVDRQKHDAQRRFSSWFVAKFKKPTPPSLRDRDEPTLQRERSERLRTQKLSAVANLQSATSISTEYQAGTDGISEMKHSGATERRAAVERQSSYLRSQLKEMKRLSQEALLRHRRSVQRQEEAEALEEQDQETGRQRVESGESEEEDVKNVEEGDDELLRIGRKSEGEIKENNTEEEEETTAAATEEDGGDSDQTEKQAEDETKADAPEPAAEAEAEAEAEAVPVSISVSVSSAEDNQETNDTPTTPNDSVSRRSSITEDTTTTTTTSSTPTTSRRNSLEEDTTKTGRDRRGSTPEDIERRMTQAALLFEEAMLLAEQALQVESPVPTPTPVRRVPPPAPRAPAPHASSASKIAKPSYYTRPRAPQTVQKAVFAKPENEWI